ncbi:MAG: sulfite exporter TauE/SafE family protein [Xenococcaceae cyanobacterium MO_234.B1]|nr:sulfite exporter TauE/SafE family protein [Xenococcaceae cyanobacterium MO_234.B1]
MIDLLLIATLGFLGSFGHCAGMCGALTVSFALSSKNQEKWWTSLVFHLLLNGGRIVSYGLVGGILGSFGNLLFTSQVRQIMAIITGLLLIWWGLIRIKPDFLPQLPIIHPLQGKLHQILSLAMNRVANRNSWWTPVVLGLLWGLIPCGFLYIAQIKSAETGDIWWGAATMLAFGLGTMPTMLGVGVSASRISADKRSQLFRLGGWITLIIGILTLLRTQAMIDYTGHGALLLLMLALIARPISAWWRGLLQYRRLIGVSSYILAIAHTLHQLDHSLNWQPQAISFMLPSHQLGLISGIVALLLMTPAAITSSDRWQNSLGKSWHKIHLLCVPALILGTIHTIYIGSHYLGELEPTWHNQGRTIVVILISLGVLGMRIKMRK